MTSYCTCQYQKCCMVNASFVQPKISRSPICFTAKPRAKPIVGYDMLVYVVTVSCTKTRFFYSRVNMERSLSQIQTDVSAHVNQTCQGVGLTTTVARNPWQISHHKSPPMGLSSPSKARRKQLPHFTTVRDQPQQGPNARFASQLGTWGQQNFPRAELMLRPHFNSNTGKMLQLCCAARVIRRVLTAGNTRNRRPPSRGPS